jgi:predicted amidophosphoribosyltransferase
MWIYLNIRASYSETMEAFSRAVDTIFPRTCLSCGTPVSGPLLFCAECLARVGTIGEYVCSSCGARIAGTGHRHPGSIPLFAAFRYEDGPVKESLHAFKYDGVEAAGRTFALLVNPLFPRPVSSVAFVPIPLHPSRERERGYNQSALFAEAMASLLAARGIGATVLSGVLRRTRKTQSQTEMESHAARRINVRDSFEVRTVSECASSLVLLVDDVSTSGATIEEAAAALKKARVPHLAGLVIAKA